MKEVNITTALKNIRVLDLSRYLAGPLCGMLLADMGAEVIRIEPLNGMVDRTWGILGPDGETLTFKILGRNKKAITLNLTDDKGKAIFKKLVSFSDVVLHNFPPGTTLGTEISYENLKMINPAIIAAVVSGYGLNGPDSQKVCFDFVAQARSAAMTLNGFPDDPPLKATVPYIDCSTGIMAAYGIMLALYHREKTGKGQLVDVALFDMASFITQNLGALLYYVVYGEVRKQLGNFGFASFMTCLKAKDGWVMVVVASDDIWKRFIRAIGKEDELGTDPKFKNDMLRSLNSPLIDSMVQEWARKRMCDDVVDILQSARVACSRVNTVDQLIDDPQSVAREMITYANYPNLGEIPIPGMPIKFSETPGYIATPAPRVGEHNEETYCGLLGFSGEEVKKFKQEGII